MPVHLELPREHPHVALVTLDRPDKANSLDPQMLVELAAAWQRVAEDDEIRCAVLTAAGDRVFSGGMDLASTIPAAQRLAKGERVSELEFEGLRCASTAVLAGFDLRTPLICAINGHCHAVGFDLMLASELRLAVPEASFALQEVAIGLYPTGNATVLLARQIPWVHALDLMLSAQPIDSERALAIGLVNELVPREELLERALARADRIAANAPLAVRATRAGVRELLSMPLEEAYRRQEELGRPLRATEDAREGQRSFLEKRRPHFQGR
jgi:enoyl-CoA hydratase